MLQASPRLSDVRRHLSRRPLGMLATALATMWLGTAAECLPEAEPSACNEACVKVDDCGFQSVSACEASSCNAVSGAVNNSGVTSCIEAADDCLAVAACGCDDACEKSEECLGSPDPECSSNCDTLVTQESKETYLENVCKLETSCEDLATCGAVSG